MFNKSYFEKIMRELTLIFWRLNWRIKRSLAGIDKKIIEDYFSNHKIQKLHIGCGNNILNGWLNSDYYPQSARILHLDATGRFPFQDDTFHYVFSEHMIEHIPYEQGVQMLTECHRVLKPLGKLRICTPDLSFLIDLYKTNKSELQKKYIKWMTDTFIRSAPYYEDTFVINHFFRGWGHRFIYDEKVLAFSFRRAGFTEITKAYLSKSECPDLRDLENVKRMPPAHLQLESLIVQGTKPYRGS